MKSFLLLIFFFFLGINSSLAQQKAKETVFLKFDPTSTQKCKVAIAGEGYQNVNKFRKRAIKGYITFSICDQKFGFETDKAKKAAITKIEERKINYSCIKYMLEIHKNSRPEKFKHHIFKNIYIVEKISDSLFVKYKVGWVDESIGSIDN